MSACKRIFKAFSAGDFYGPKAQHLYFYGEVNKESVYAFRARLYAACKAKISNTNVSSKPKPIVVHVHSSGGDGHLGLTLANLLREVSAPVAVVVDGYACSAITPMVVSAPYRVVHDFSFVLFHEAALRFQKPGSIKQSEIHFQVHKVLPTLVAEYKKIYQHHTKLKGSVLDDMLQRDLFMNANACIRSKVADRLLSINKGEGHSRWQGFITNNPDFQVPDDPFAWHAGLNHLYTDPGGIADKDDMVTDDRLFQGVLNAVKPMQAIMQDSTGSAPKPVVLHTNLYTTPGNARWFDVAPLMARVFYMPTPVLSVIDSDVDILQALPCLLAHRRYMYANTHIYIRLVFDHASMPMKYYHDIKANVDMLRGVLRGVLGDYARLPVDKLDRLFEDHAILTAQQCKEYGLIDEIIEPHARPDDALEQAGGMRPSRRRVKHALGQTGGCACSQGLPMDYIPH